MYIRKGIETKKMTTFQELYSDDEQQTFYQELYPLAEKCIMSGKIQLQEYIRDANKPKWDEIRTALISISSDMCFYTLKHTLETCSKPSSINYANITIAIEQCLYKHCLKRLYVDC